LGAIAAADFNQDGWPDVAITNSNWNAHSVTVLINRGDGTLGAPVTYQVVSDPTDITAADVNGDAIADIVVGNRSSGHISVLINKGDGTFLPAKNFVAGSILGDRGSIEVADFTGDGKPDIAAIARINGTDYHLVILRGTGTGRFRAPIAFYPGAYPFDLDVGDFNGDGRPDVAVADVQYNGAPSQVNVLMNSGNGAFSLTASYDTGYSAGDVEVGDFDGDGKIDLVVGNPSAISVLLGNGDGTFQPRVVYAAPQGALHTADINNDGKLDLVIGASVAVMFGNGDGSFQTSSQTYSIGSNGALAIADVNQDGWLDVMSGQLQGVVVLLSAGDWPAPAPGSGRTLRRVSNAIVTPEARIYAKQSGAMNVNQFDATPPPEAPRPAAPNGSNRSPSRLVRPQSDGDLTHLDRLELFDIT
jgi:hypothetical protein